MGLILTRLESQTIRIGDNVSVAVRKIKGGGKGGSVRLEINAPDSVKILRGELLDHGDDDPEPGKQTPQVPGGVSHAA